MSDQNSVREAISKIVVRLRVGTDLMAGSDDPLFLGLRGPSGREFRLLLARGKSLRRGAEDVYCLAASDDPDTNVAHTDLNDPTTPPMDAAQITSVFLRKGLEPIPNVRGLGEMDDRLQVMEADVEIHAAGLPKPRRYTRHGPLWLGLVCGLTIDLAPLEEPR